MAKYETMDGKVRLTIADKDIKNFYEAICEITKEEPDYDSLVSPERKVRVGNIVIYGWTSNVYSEGRLTIGKHTGKRYTCYDIPWEDIYYLKGMAEYDLGINTE